MKLKLPFDISKLKKIKKDQLLIVFLIGVLLLVIVIPVDDNSKKTSEEKESDAKDTSQYYKELSKEDYQKTMEEKLKNILESMDGVGKVEVMITLKDTGESVVEKDLKKSEQNTTEEDGAGTKRNSAELNLEEETVYSGDDTSSSYPFVSKEINPKVEGVLVVAQGGGNSKIIKNISDAVLALFPIEAHKIMVVKMNH